MVNPKVTISLVILIFSSLFFTGSAHSGKLIEQNKKKNINHQEQVDKYINAITEDFESLKKVLYLEKKPSFITTNFLGLPVQFMFQYGFVLQNFMRTPHDERLLGNIRLKRSRLDDNPNKNIPYYNSQIYSTYNDIIRVYRGNKSRNKKPSQLRGLLSKNKKNKYVLHSYNDKLKILFGVAIDYLPSDKRERIFQTVLKKQNVLIMQLVTAATNEWAPLLFYKTVDGYTIKQQEKKKIPREERKKKILPAEYKPWLTIANHSKFSPAKEGRYYMITFPDEIRIARSSFRIENFDHRYSFKKMLDGKVNTGTAEHKKLKKYDAYYDVETGSTILFNMDSGKGYWQDWRWDQMEAINNIYGQKIPEKIIHLYDVIIDYNRMNLINEIQQANGKVGSDDVSF